MEEKNKLKLKDLQIKSFVTTPNSGGIMGGVSANQCTEAACQYRTWLIGRCAPNSGGNDGTDQSVFQCETAGPCQTGGGGICPSQPPHCPTVQITCNNATTC